MQPLLKQLKEIEEWLNNHNVVAYLQRKRHTDGRIASMLYEDAVVDNIAQNFPQVREKKSNRDFGDFYLEVGGVEYPVNVKLNSENGSGNGNLVGTAAIMRHIFFNGKGIQNHKEIAQKIKNGEYSESFNDYGFLSISKETGRAVAATMLTMEGYVANPANGFQANFDNITINPNKSFWEGRNYLLGKYREYLRKKAEAFLILEGKEDE